jgi:hypothetical protein
VGVPISELMKCDESQVQRRHESTQCIVHTLFLSRAM